ncbi:helix-turn-helix transcriptional regulator [Phytohabitans suffuscus]|uniref:HTH luxR-type domain-containing protein n=1 Tax=Phytohabitans suffuscus TaxID=624315 RepID=A0A6F8YAC1_9ACTN|nr:LuxR C-terminal-related transcriptional regulator [Phytohabitans suffuscus]BCB82901.1 hypothetical protein Psuf_002140 [Phytohabitans suffuscus]
MSALEKVAPTLTRWGMPADAEVVYRAVGMRSHSTALDLARELGMARVRVDRALSLLHDAGLVRPSRPRPGLHWSVDETVDLNRFGYGSRRPSRDRLAPAGAARDGEVRLGREHFHLTSRAKAQHRVNDLLEVARRELLTFNTERTFEPATLQAVAASSHRLFARGVQVRELGVGDHDPDLLVPYGGLRLSPSIYRVAGGRPMKLIVIDRRVALFPVDPGNHERGYLEVSNPAVVESLVRTFETHWDAGAGLPEDGGRDFVLSPREEAVVALLAAGQTDAATARKLSISERSVSNVVRGLMDRLGVGNRFQLGLALGRLAAVPLPPKARVRADPEKQPGPDPG